MSRMPETTKALVVYGNGDYRPALNYPVPEWADDIILRRRFAASVREI